MPTDTGSLLDRLLCAIEPRLPDAIRLRHELHAEPEPAHAEVQTGARVLAALPDGARRIARTGVVVRVGRSEQAAVAVRSELDGLPIVERTTASFRSANGSMHACGHDVHAAALVALAGAADELRDVLPVPLLAVFQPSEEAYPSGARCVLDEWDGLEPVSAIVAAHVHPDLPWNTVGLDPGAVNAAADTVEIRFLGRAAHAAYPHHGNDAVLALAQAIVGLHATVGRRVDPMAAAVVNVGTVRAGSVENVVAGEAEAVATLRALDERDRHLLRTAVSEVAEHSAAMHGCRAELRFVEGEPALVNDPAIVAHARDLLRGLAVEPGPPWRSCGADDFAFFTAAMPGAMAFVGLSGAPGFDPRPLHNPEFLPPDDAVAATARVQAALYVAAATASQEPA